MPIAAGRRLGPYEVISSLGAGGMGEVYRARDPKLGRDVAIKVLLASVASDPERRARFEREAQAVAALSHPNILAVHEFGVHDDQLFVVTELLEGETLRERLGAGPLPVRKTTDIAVQLARGLAAAHGKGLVHRDLKPENVFLLSDGQVKILDFGLARPADLERPDSATETRTSTSPLTDPGTVMGTVGYMAPEQVRAQAVDGRADLFALGAMIHEMLTGERAFLRETTADTMTAVLTSDPPALVDSRADVPAALDRIIRHCLEKNPNERFQTARDVGFALEALSGSGTSSGPVLPAAPATRRAPIIAAALAVLAIAGAYVLGRGATTGGGAPPAFAARTFDPQNIFNARFGPDGATIYFSAALEGTTPELFVSRPDHVLPEPVGRPGTHLLSVSSTGELAVLIDARLLAHRLFSGTLARMMPDGEPRPLDTGVREADWLPDGSALAVIRQSGASDQLESPSGNVLYTAPDGRYLSDLRVAPDGSRIAFMEHPGRFDNRGWVKVVDAARTVTTLTDEYWALEGLAWTGRDQIAFGASLGGANSYQPLVVPASGAATPEAAFSTPGAVYVLDVSEAGTWLATTNDSRFEMRGRLAGDELERDLSWIDGGLGPTMSADGRGVLFNDQSQFGGDEYSVMYHAQGARRPIRLGPGVPSGLSHDGQWALAREVGRSSTRMLYPIGPGSPKTVDIGMTSVSWNAFFPDGSSLLVCGRDPSEDRCYKVPVAGGAPEPVTSEGQWPAFLAPDGRTLLKFGGNAWEILTIGGSQSTAPRGVQRVDLPMRWASDSRSIFVRVQSGAGWRIDRVNVFTGDRSTIREVAPADTVGLLGVEDVDVSEDGEAYVYAYMRRRSTLYVVTGVGGGR